jgi:hypothetical protein
MSQFGKNANALGCELAGEIVRTFGRVRVRVTGTSMIPAVWPGDVLVVERRAVEKIQRGEIAVAERAGRLVAHRVVSAPASSALKPTATNARRPNVALAPHAGPASSAVITPLLTRGDSQLAPDEPLHPEELLGTVVLIERGRAARQPQRGLNFAAKLVARMAQRSTTAARVLVRLHDIFTPRPERVALCKS